MRDIEKTVLVLVGLLALTYANTEEDNEVTVDDDKINHKEEVELIHDTKHIKGAKQGKILWPYPLKKENATKDSEGQKEMEKIRRKARFLLWSYPQSPIADMVMQTVGVNYQARNPRDPFDFLRDSYPLPKGYTTPLDEYDYVIIGAGSAGSVLAARLTEDKPRAMVLVIEAGKPEMLLSDIPAMAHFLQMTDYSWQYYAERQPNICLGSADQRCFWPQGRAVGGTSVTNYMLYTRGRREDWDRIAADGNYGWSYNDVLQYYLKSEKAELKRLNKPQYHSRDGELSVENAPFRTRLIEAFLEAGRLSGSPTVDYNSPDEMGFGYVQTTSQKGHRMSSARAFLHPHKRRRNLHILTETKATKVIIEPQTKRAYAVEYIKNGKKHKVRARREVIISAGPIASPQLLLLSGVGPQEHLKTIGIPVVKDLQVGRSLYDHICFPGVVFKLNTTNASLFESKIATLPNLFEWMQFGEGLLTTTFVEGIGYIKTPASEDPERVPDIELMSMAGSINFDSGGNIIKSWGLTEETYQSAFGTLNGVDTWSAVPMLLHPKSKGYIELRDRNPYSPPKIVSNYLSDPKDVETLKEAVKQIIMLGESQPFKKFGSKLHLGHYHTCMTLPPGSEQYWECAIRTLMISLQHQVATTKMGPPSDPEAVVDPELRVYGVDGLRVVGAGIIPKPISAHTNAPAIMIGEKAADLIKRTWANVVV